MHTTDGRSTRQSPPLRRTVMTAVLTTCLTIGVGTVGGCAGDQPSSARNRWSEVDGDSGSLRLLLDEQEVVESFDYRQPGVTLEAITAAGFDLQSILDRLSGADRS